MIQELQNKEMYNQYSAKEVTEKSKIFCFDKGELLQKGEWIPTYQQIREVVSKDKLIYLFCIGAQDYFLVAPNCRIELAGYSYEKVRVLRTFQNRELIFAGMTAYHLYQWYRANIYCGACSQPLELGTKERVLCCPACGNMVYPKVAPAVIVAVTDGDRIVLTRYRDREYKKYALIAGFTEIGETAEETVKREVM